MNRIKKMNRIIPQYKKILLAAVLVLAISLMVVIAVTAQTGGGFDLSWYVVSSGAARSQHEAPDYVLYSTVGQTAAGESIHSPSYTLWHGFWQNFDDVLFTRLPLAAKH
jgi:hypothetical protein